MINVKIDGGIPPSSGQTDCGENGLVCGGYRLVMASSGRPSVYSKAMAHQRVNSAATGHHYGTH